MITVRLLGKFKKLIGSEFKFNSETLAETFKALFANFPHFRNLLTKHIRSGGEVAVYTDDDYLLDKDELYRKLDGIIYIYPIIRLRGFGSFLSSALGLIAIGGLIFAGGWMLAGIASEMLVTAMYGMGTSLILSGVLSFFMPAAKTPSSQSVEDSTSSFFSGAGYDLSSGSPIPIGYGKMRVPGTPVSVRVATEIVE